MGNEMKTSKDVFNAIKKICNNFAGTNMDHTAICSLYSQIEEFYEEFEKLAEKRGAIKAYEEAIKVCSEELDFVYHLKQLKEAV